jgi:hypothetical protein
MESVPTITPNESVSSTILILQITAGSLLEALRTLGWSFTNIILALGPSRWTLQRAQSRLFWTTQPLESISYSEGALPRPRRFDKFLAILVSTQVMDTVQEIRCQAGGTQDEPVMEQDSNSSPRQEASNDPGATLVFRPRMLRVT